MISTNWAMAQITQILASTKVTTAMSPPTPYSPTAQPPPTWESYPTGSVRCPRRRGVIAVQKCGQMQADDGCGLACPVAVAGQDLDGIEKMHECEVKREADVTEYRRQVQLEVEKKMKEESPVLLSDHDKPILVPHIPLPVRPPPPKTLRSRGRIRQQAWDTRNLPDQKLPSMNRPANGDVLAFLQVKEGWWRPIDVVDALTQYSAMQVYGALRRLVIQGLVRRRHTKSLNRPEYTAKRTKGVRNVRRKRK